MPTVTKMHHQAQPGQGSCAQPAADYGPAYFGLSTALHVRREVVPTRMEAAADARSDGGCVYLYTAPGQGRAASRTWERSRRVAAVAVAAYLWHVSAAAVAAVCLLLVSADAVCLLLVSAAAAAAICLLLVSAAAAAAMCLLLVSAAAAAAVCMLLVFATAGYLLLVSAAAAAVGLLLTSVAAAASVMCLLLVSAAAAAGCRPLVSAAAAATRCRSLVPAAVATAGGLLLLVSAAATSTAAATAHWLPGPESEADYAYLSTAPGRGREVSRTTGLLPYMHLPHTHTSSPPPLPPNTSSLPPLLRPHPTLTLHSSHIIPPVAGAVP